MSKKVFFMLMVNIFLSFFLFGCEVSRITQDQKEIILYIKNNDISAAKEFISTKEKNFLNFRDSSGKTPLGIAIDSGNFKMAKTLLMNGANPKFYSHEGKRVISPLYQACASDKFDKDFDDFIFQLLLKTSMDKGYIDLGIEENKKSISTPLLISSIKGHHWKISLLITYGADVNKSDSKGKTCLEYILFGKHDKFRSELIKKLMALGTINKIKLKNLADKNQINFEEYVSKYCLDLKPSRIRFRDFYKCEKCKSLYAFAKYKFNEIYLRNPKAKDCFHQWDRVKKIDIYNLSLKWFDIKWNKCGLWYRILTDDRSKLDKAIKTKSDFNFHPDYWIPPSAYKQEKPSKKLPGLRTRRSYRR